MLFVFFRKKKEEEMQTSAALKHGFEKVEARRARIERWFLFYGFEVKIPFPKIENGFKLTDAEYSVKQNKGWELFFRPASKEVSYPELIRELGQKFHWTQRKQVRSNISWQPAKVGYWFWAQIDKPILVSENCRKLIDRYLKSEKRFPCLEEYAIVWHLRKDETGQELDLENWIWLRAFLKNRILSAMGESGYGINVGSMSGAHVFQDKSQNCAMRLVEPLG
jgi:hypothetical protein